MFQKAGPNPDRRRCCAWPQLSLSWQAAPADTDSSALAISESGMAFIAGGADDPLQYLRVQRVRSKKATVWLDAVQTLPKLIISAVMLVPLERMMSPISMKWLD